MALAIANIISNSKTLKIINIRTTLFPIHNEILDVIDESTSLEETRLTIQVSEEELEGVVERIKKIIKKRFSNQICIYIENKEGQLLMMLLINFIMIVWIKYYIII